MESEHNKMSDSIRNIGFFAAIGTLLATLIIGGIAIAGFRIPSLRLPSLIPNKGRLTVQVTDSPADLKHLNITIDKLLIQKSDGENITLDLKGDAEAIYFDLLALYDVTLTLSETEIPAGNYTMIRMHVLTANATYATGENVTLRVPSDKIDVIVHFQIKPGETTMLLLDMQADWVAISHSKNLRPVLKATVISG